MSVRKNAKPSWSFHREISFREVVIYYFLPKCNFFVQLTDIIVSICKIKYSNLKTVIGTEIFMQCIEERRKTPSISGISVCSVLGISRITWYSRLKGRKNVRLKRLQGQWSTVHQQLWSVYMQGPAKSMPKQRSRFSFCVKTLTVRGLCRIFWR